MFVMLRRVGFVLCSLVCPVPALWESAAPRTELHIHLDGTISFDTLWDIATQRHLSLPDGIHSADDLSRYCSAHSPDQSFSFRWFGCVLGIAAGDVDSIELVAERFVEWQKQSGVEYTEVRYSPQLLASSTQYNVSITPNATVAAVTRGLLRGLQRHPEMRVHQILCAYRELPPAHCDEIADLVVDWAKVDRSLPATVVGMDLAGNETWHPNPLFFECFRRAQQLGVRNITIHAGEFPEVSPQSVAQAVEIMGARRIGHGYAAWKDDKVIALIQSRGVHLEVCPSTCINEYHFPLPGKACPAYHFKAHGITDASVSTDDPYLWNTTLGHEYEQAQNRLNIDPIHGSELAYNARFGP